MPLSFPIVALGSQLFVMVADSPPNFDMARTCRLDLSAAFGLSAGPQDDSCIRDERNARQQLQKQWLKFPAIARANCASQESIGGTPSYVSLLTCLQMSNGK
jgi:hypothetical protein